MGFEQCYMMEFLERSPDGYHDNTQALSAQQPTQAQPKHMALAHRNRYFPYPPSSSQPEVSKTADGGLHYGRMSKRSVGTYVGDERWWGGVGYERIATVRMGLKQC